jgi:drug/metabolite transporter (DMT)-like permease
MNTLYNERTSTKAFVLLLTGGIIVGMGPILAKVINAPAISIVFYRIMLPIPILILLKIFFSDKPPEKDATSFLNDLLLMIVIGIFFSLDLIAFYFSLKFTSIASATLLSNLSPVFLVTYALVMKKELNKEIFWPLLSIIGLILLCGLKINSVRQQLLGNSIALLAAFFFTGYILLINKLGRRYNSVDIMLWSSLGGSIFLIILCVLMKIDMHITTAHDLLFLLLMSLGTQLIGQTILTKGITNFPPSLSSLGILIDPVAAAFFAWILLGESLTNLEIIGACLILISIVFAYKYKNKMSSRDNHQCVK